MREIRTSGSMSGDGKRSTRWELRHWRSQQTATPPIAATAPVLDSTDLTAKARNRPAITSLPLVTVLDVLSSTPACACLVLMGLSRTFARHVVRSAG